MNPLYIPTKPIIVIQPCLGSFVQRFSLAIKGAFDKRQQHRQTLPFGSPARDRGQTLNPFSPPGWFPLERNHSVLHRVSVPIGGTKPVEKGSLRVHDIIRPA